MRKWILAILLISSGLYLPAQTASLQSLLPRSAEIPGWQLTRDPELYSGDGLFDLIDGGADLFYEYRFKTVINTQYGENNGSKIQLEIYEMDSDTSAYGIFSSIYNSSDVNRHIGLFSAVNDQYIAFVKDRYYVNIAWVIRKDAKAESLLSFAMLVSDKISKKGKQPALVKALENIPHDGIPIYFRGNIALSNVYYIDFKDHFEISQGLALKAASTTKLIFAYQDREKVQAIFTGIHEFIDGSKRFRDPGMIYQGFTCFDNKGNRLVFRLGDGFITVMVAPSTDVQFMSQQEDFFNQVEQALNIKR